MKVVSKGKAAGVLRLAFHDAGTFQMNENSGTCLEEIVLGRLKKDITSFHWNLQTPP